MQQSAVCMCFHSTVLGGTDIVGCFASQSWAVPVVRGEIQARVLGCAMECWDEEGTTRYYNVSYSWGSYHQIIIACVSNRQACIW